MWDSYNSNNHPKSPLNSGFTYIYNVQFLLKSRNLDVLKSNLAEVFDKLIKNAYKNAQKRCREAMKFTFALKILPSETEIALSLRDRGDNDSSEILEVINHIEVSL